MSIPPINQITAITDSVKTLPLLAKKSTDLAGQLSVSLVLNAHLQSISQSTEELTVYIDQMIKFEKQLSTAVVQAGKKKISCKAAILNKKPAPAKSPSEIWMHGPEFLNKRWSEAHLSYLVFDNARTGNYPDRTVIIAESDLNEDQKKRFMNWCAFLASAKVEPHVVLIQGRTGLEKWEKLFAQSELNNVTLELLENDNDLPAYTRKLKARLICLPYQTGQSKERLLALHQINRADILLF